jgi:hypothetical protein
MNFGNPTCTEGINEASTWKNENFFVEQLIHFSPISTEEPIMLCTPKELT